MTFREPIEPNFSNPIVIWGQRFLVVVLFLICGLMLAADRLFPGSTDSARARTTDILAPMVSAANAPVLWTKKRINGGSAYFNTVQKAANADRLDGEVTRLENELDRVLREVAELRAAVNLPPQGIESYLTARVLIEGDSLFGASLVLNVGSRDGRLLFDRAYSEEFRRYDSQTGAPLPFADPCLIASRQNIPPHCRLVPVKEGLAVVSRFGIIGRLVEVGYNSARVRLITSQESALPVLVGNLRIKATVFGNDTDLLELRTNEAVPGSIRIGDEVLTSSIDADIPYLFRVGKVIETNPDIIVRPYAVAAEGIEDLVQVVLREPLDLVNQNNEEPSVQDEDIPILDLSDAEVLDPLELSQ